MATTKGKGTGARGSAPADDTTTEAAPRARGARTRAPEDEISGTAARQAKAAPAARGRGGRAAPGAGVTAADTPAADAATSAPQPRTRRSPGTGVADAAPAPAKSSGGRKKRETYQATAARRRKEKEIDHLQADLRAFAIARPGGWNHQDWESFVGHLAQRGHDVREREAIGVRLERERLAVALESIEGLGPKRVHSLVDRFQTLWSMRHADAGDVATVAGMTRPLAERVVRQLRERYS